MVNRKTNLVLVGMPGAGKSTVGIVLAKITARNFTDTDVLIQTSAQRRLQEILNTDGYLALRKLEEDILLRLSVDNHVIATGGSAVYSDSAMQHLKKIGIIIFLDTDLSVLLSRLTDIKTRGIASKPGQSFEALFTERYSLYKKYSDYSIPCSHLSQEQICQQILAGVV